MPVIINSVWFSNDPLRPLDRFNVYCWRALGHIVNIYTCKLDLSDHTTLGVKEKNVNIINLSQFVRTSANPKMPKVRELLIAWLDAAGSGSPTQDQKYNIGDLAKSYIAGTARGIVMDLKVGPSKWVAGTGDIPGYETIFNTKFISYTRGTNTATLPENQCMGTMQEANTLRHAYGEKIESGCTAFPEVYNQYKTVPNGTYFGTVTSWHGKAADKIKYLNTAKTSPSNAERPTNRTGQLIYGVKEILRENGHGPFRVFKLADDQSNRPGGPKTKPSDQLALAQWVYENEMQSLTGTEAQHFTKKLPKILAETWA